MKPSKVCLLFFLSGIAQVAHPSGTSIGNGGDPVFYFLESTRHSLRTTLLDIELGENREQLCHSLEHLSEEQKQDCASFGAEIIPQLTELNAPTDPIQFVLRESPLLVEGPDGELMPVAARTALGPEGAIEFHKASIQFMSPSQLLFLITHEYGHKVEFRGQWVADNVPILSFPNGRMLLDAFATSVVKYAVRRGHIGHRFGLRDIFTCHVQSKAGSFDVRVSTSRHFRGDSYERYELSLGHLPSDPQVSVPELSQTQLILRLRISEPAGCAERTNLTGRSTSLDIVRERTDTSFRKSPEVIARSEYPGMNPICLEESPWLVVETESLSFRCRHLGTDGQSQ